MVTGSRPRAQGEKEVMRPAPYSSAKLSVEEVDVDADRTAETDVCVE